MFRKRLCAVVALVALLIPLSLATPSPQATPAVHAADPPQTTRQGAWLDSMVFSKQNSAWTAVSQLQADELDLYAFGLSSPSLWQAVLEGPNLTYTESFGSYNELTLNPSGPEFNDGRLNPFSNAKIREAMNWLIDRDVIVQEIFGGMASPKFTILSSISADYDRYRTTVEGIETAYAYNLTHAQQVIAAEMTAMGATLVNGIWHYDGQPVTVIFLIRVEDLRRNIGDYVAGQLEQMGFVVDRQYKTSGEASPLWVGSDPAEGLWHLYTGGWVTLSISRDDAGSFGFFYTSLGFEWALWQAYQPTPEFYDLCERLYNNDFASIAERDALFEQALSMAMDDDGPGSEGSGSLRIWLVDNYSVTPRKTGTAVASDMSGGVVGAAMFPYVARFEGVEGGDMRIAQPDLLLTAWNPIAGSNSIYDQMPTRATADYATLSDPNTGLFWAQRVESAECVVQAGLPVTKTLDWVDLSFAPVITVPADAWADWDASTQTFIAASDMPTPTLQTKTKCTITYPVDLFTTVTWHDGSPLDLSDFIMRMILQFDRAKPESDLYDDSSVAQYNTFMSHFRGVEIVSASPLVITTYDDQLYLDAELLAQGMTWWPGYDRGPGAWHTLASGIRAEAAGQLAFSDTKAGSLGVEWTNYIGGDSLNILAYWTNQSATQHYIPYLPTMGAYVTQPEADARWAALKTWYAARGHLWLGTGPFYLASIQPDLPTLTLERYAAFPDLAGRWDAFAAATQPLVEINYVSGAPGSYLTITGTGYPPGETAFIVINGELLAEVTVDSSGAIAFTLTTDEADLGVYHVRVQVNPAAGVQFTLDDAEPVRPREGDLPLVVVPAGLISYNTYLPLTMRSFP